MKWWGVLELRRVAIQAGDDLRPIWGRLALLLGALYVNRRVSHVAPVDWVAIPVLLAGVLAKARYSEGERAIVRLWQWVGLLSAFYSLLHYPLMPVAHHDFHSEGRYGVLLLAWVISTACGLLCFRVPSLAILPAAFLAWSNSAAGAITGLPITEHIDIQPLTEVSTCIGLGLLINQINSWKYRGESTKKLAVKAANDGFAHLLLLLVIAVHLANYYWAFYAKVTLNGPRLAWLREENAAYIFLTALDDGHIFFSGYPRLVQWVYHLLDTAHLYSNAGILMLSGAAITAFFMPKRIFLLLLLMFDLMHLSIILIVGADFWPWILLNVIVAFVVARAGFVRQPVIMRMIATGFILVAPMFVHVTKLGWYDTGANNKLYLVAVDESGRRTPVPDNFFTFYSYSFGHMDYGMPDPEDAFALGTPNGGSQNYQFFKAGETCDVAALVVPNYNEGFDREKLPAFIRNYHRLALASYSNFGMFPYNVYPHHFYVPGSERVGFDRLDKRTIVAYVYRRESVCLAYDGGALQRRVISSAEYRIDVLGD